MQSFPRHIAIIMDGNRRWAKRRGVSLKKGYSRGVEVLREIVRAAHRLGFPHLTFYGFSLDNRTRSAEEVAHLMGLMRSYIRGDLAELHRENVRLRLLGRREDIPGDIASLVQEAELLTAENKAMNLSIAFNYGGRDEIIRAMQRFLRACEEGKETLETLSPSLFESYLDTAGMPPPDLVIRTGGEKRLSDFLLWQNAYSELLFLDTLWPDFTATLFEEAVTEYGRRDRRFGKKMAGGEH